MATSAVLPVCPQGHGAGTPGSKFCKFCGTALVVPAAPEQPAPAAQVQAPVAAIPAPSAPLPNAIPQPPPVCKTCGGLGARLDPADIVCPGCSWLRPLYPGYQLDRSVFLWAQDGQAMTRLQQIPALATVVRTASDKVGRPWIESTFNGIRMGPRQLPHIWTQAVLAARILGLAKMPDVYVAGDQQWNTYTYGSDTSAFIVLGTALLTNFQHEELLFLLAREMGHCAAGHALWKTATRFLTGGDGTHSGPLSGGIMGAISPTKWLEGAVDIPLMAWQRQSEITADRAGLLAVGNELLARRVLLGWSIHSSRLLKQVNIEEWMKQEDASDDTVTRLSEMTTSSSMYTTRRLRLLGQAAKETNLMGWSQSIQDARKRLAPAPQAPPATRPAVPAPAKTPADSIRVVCNQCHSAMRVPFAVLRGKSSLNVRCPQCQNVLTLRSKPAAPSPAPASAETKPAAQPPAAPAAQM
jgi:Zn-dependent protease with chaperone function